MAIWSTKWLNRVNSVRGVICIWAWAVHPASSWTALGQVIAALLSLPSLFALACSPPVFYFSFSWFIWSILKMPPRCSHWAHTQATTLASCGLTALVAVPASTGAMPMFSGILYPKTILVPSSLPLVFVWVEVTLANLWSFHLHRCMSLLHHQQMSLSPLEMASLPWSGTSIRPFRANWFPRAPHNLCRASRVVLSLVSCNSSWVVKGVWCQHNASLLLWLQCPASCAVCVSWVVTGVPSSYGWLSVFVMVVSFVLASLTSVSYVGMPILILLCLPWWDIHTCMCYLLRQ